MRFNVCPVKHINALLRCSLVIIAVELFRSLLRSALLRSSLNEPYLGGRGVTRNCDAANSQECIYSG